jgi:hypothetical protein
MIISAIPPLGVSPASVDAQGSRVESVRQKRMATNATPLQAEPPLADGEPPISDNSETNPAVEATGPISPQFAALAKQRRVLQQERRTFEDEKKAFQEKSQGSGSVDLARLKSEPLSVLMEAGVTYDQLTEAILANPGNSEISTLKAEIKALKEGVDQKFTDKETQNEQQVLKQMQKEAEQLSAEGDTYELVRETGSIPDVMELIERTYRESGEVLDVSEALQLVEDELVKRQEKLLQTKKMQGLATRPNPEIQQRQPGMRTLTNKDNASIPLSAKQRALAAFYGNLKK